MHIYAIYRNGLIEQRKLISDGNRDCNWHASPKCKNEVYIKCRRVAVSVKGYTKSFSL
jgi:hypothetical protein